MATIHAACFRRAWSDGEFEALLATRGAAAWIARMRGRDVPVGFILVRQAADEAEIITIASLPKTRGRGIGGKLLDHAIREMQRERIARIVLEVDASNRAAIRLYASRGFRQIAVRQGYYQVSATGNPASDALVMALELR